MPIYEFYCESCHKKQDLMMKMADPVPTQCPECGGGPFTKLISQTSFVLKGGGWYSQGYSSATKTSETKAEPKTETKADAVSETKKEVKPETKS